MIYVVGIDRHLWARAFLKAVVMAKNRILSYQVIPSGADR